MSTTGSRDRSTLSCARCYLMKKKCDKKVPSCSRCARARTPCLDINRSDGTEVPRSAVRYLESRLAEIENDSAYLRRAALPETRDLLVPEGHERPAERVDANSSRALEVAATAIGSICSPSVLQNQLGIYYAAKLFYSSERPPLKIPVRGVYQEDPPRRASRGCSFRLPDMAALRMPFEVTKALFSNYLSNILPKYPCFDETDLMDEFNRFYSTGNSPGYVLPETTCFIVSMVLAISSLTSKAHDFRKVASLSESLHRDAMRYVSVLRDTSIRSLQSFILLIQMALLVPYTSNLWYMSGEAMRMAIALGLHQEAEGVVKLQPAQIQLRRRIFWTVYQLERTIAIASGCPLAISDEHISTLLPSQSPNDDLEPGAFNRTKMNHFLSNVQLCQIQSEIHGVQFFDQRLPKDVLDYGDWTRRMENSIQIWQQSATSDGGLPGWSVNAANHCRLLLYRPCSRNIVPPESSLQAASTTAISIIKGYWRLVQIGNLILSFQYVYNVFQAGMVLLYALRNHSATVRNSSLEEEGHSTLALLIRLLDALSERWPVAADTGYYIQELKDSVLRSIESGPNQGRSAYDVSLLAELDFMVTQRRIHSLYHRNLEVLPPEERFLESPLRAQSDSFTPFPDELWQEFIDTGFQYFADDSLLLLESPGSNVTTQPNDPGQGEDIAIVSIGNIEGSKAATEAGQLIKSLPACGFCRKQHIKCDREFPYCTTCRKSNRECTYYDVVLQQDVSRSYVYSLYERLTEITKSGNSGSIPAEFAISGRSWSPRHKLGSNIFVPCERGGSSTSNPGTNLNNWFFGRSSAVAFLERAISLNGKYDLAEHATKGVAFPTQSTFGPECHDAQPPPESVASSLFRLYSRSVNLFYPTMTKFQLDTILTDMYHNQNLASNPEGDLFYLIIAITTRMMRTPVPGLVFTSHAYFQKATRHQNEGYHGNAMHSLLLLQKTLLIAIYLLLSPESGDVWRNLGFAIRLYFDISHRPSENDGMDEVLMSMLSRTLYCLECPVSIAFGRPSLLVIGDTLRESMIKPMSIDIEERVAIYFYRISLLKMQIHSKLLAEPGTLGHDMFGEDYQMYRRELDAWQKDWQRELDLFREDASINQDDTMPVFEAWANLNYHHTALLVNNLSPTTIHCPLEHGDQIIRCCGFLIRQKQRSLLPGLLPAVDQLLSPLFPTDWTVAHLISSVGLSLVGREKQYGPGECQRIAAMGRCLGTLALLEGAPENLCTGFSEFLEKLFYDG